MTRTRRRSTRGTTASRCATGLATLSLAVSVSSVATTTACGMGGVVGHDDARQGASYAYDTASPAPRSMTPVRVHGHMGQPGRGDREAAVL